MTKPTMGLAKPAQQRYLAWAAENHGLALSLPTAIYSCGGSSAIPTKSGPSSTPLPALRDSEDSDSESELVHLDPYVKILGFIYYSSEEDVKTPPRPALREEAAALPAAPNRRGRRRRPPTLPAEGPSESSMASHHPSRQSIEDPGSPRFGESTGCSFVGSAPSPPSYPCRAHAGEGGIVAGCIGISRFHVLTLGLLCLQQPEFHNTFHLLESKRLDLFRLVIQQSQQGLTTVDLSNNNLSRIVPNSLEALTDLQVFNVSHNKLRGEIPNRRVFPASLFNVLQTTPISAALRLEECMSRLVLNKTTKDLNVFPGRWKQTKEKPPAEDISLWRLISYMELVRGTASFNDTTVIGRGSFGSVFKATLSDSLNIAVKVFNLQRAKSLILKILNIAIDVALALEYLHHNHTFAVLHCDLKPSNVLLDENMIAHVGDFGISKLFDEGEAMTQTKTFATVGYAAPV
ncbi:unnamed protein product [Cuscuta campestris]|uniref:Protein kinase domain-containing protein n=1 Tax=Cuscuta campestris TaxID=132261 RepID=A0A484M0H1_9ASTE|nr:unnamed protein product [Cuscuta campestris]